MKQGFSYFTLLVFLIFAPTTLRAQIEQDTTQSKVVDMDIKDHVIIDDSLELTYISLLNEILLVDFQPLSKDEKKDYYRLRRKVLKVYPYALEASNLFVEVTSKYQEISKRRKRRKYTRRKEKWVKEVFSEQLKKLTKSEGRVLIKLINRNTQITTHELIKTYRGGLSAFFWQRMAKFYDSDLKMIYSPEINREDQLIEMIIQKAIRADLIEESKLSPYQIQPFLDEKDTK